MSFFLVKLDWTSLSSSQVAWSQFSRSSFMDSLKIVNLLPVNEIVGPSEISSEKMIAVSKIYWKSFNRIHYLCNFKILNFL